MRLRILITSLVMLSLLAGCSNKNPLPTSGYRTARAQSSLELPPDLVNNTTASVRQAAASDTNRALANLEGVEFRSSGDKRWLEVAADAESVWLKMVDYFNKSGMPILVENKRDGILETDWIGDEESDSYFSSLVRSKAGDLFGRAPVNDKYTMWLEKIDDTHTTVNIQHKQLKQFVIDPQGQRKDNIQSGWIETSGDSFKELQLMRDMAAFFAGAEIETDNTARVVLVQSIPPYIVLAEGSEKAWELVERAIITSPYTLDGEDLEKQLFKIRAPEESGFWSAITPADKYGVILVPQNQEKTRISITSNKGKDTIEREDALPVLWALAGELRRMEAEE